MRDNKVQSVLRAINLLKIISTQPNGIGIVDLARQSGLHKSTVSRLVTTLEVAGAVERLSHRGNLSIDPTFAQLFLQLQAPHTLIPIVRPLLEQLSLQLNEAVGLAIPQGWEALYVTQVSPNSVVQVRDWTGSRFPLHTVSAGKLFLAFQNETEQSHYLSQPLAAFTTNTVTDPNELKRSLADIRTSGISWIYNEFADGLSAVAAPVFNRKGHVIAAISVYGPSYRFPKEESIIEINQHTLQTADLATQKLQQLLST